jgi:polysaccharide pyruvyl transferase WcaK-like protein
MYAHRLHSNIAAFSYAVPHVGFAWDRKLESFLAFVGRRECLAKVAEDGVSETVELGRRQLQSGIDRAQHRTVLERARSDIGEIAAAVRQTIGLSDAGARETARA